MQKIILVRDLLAIDGRSLRQWRNSLASLTALGTVLAAVFAASGPALAACSPVPTNGPDTITCAGDANINLSALGGNDTINVNSGFFGTQAGLGSFSGDDGDDTFNLTEGSIRDALGGRGNDTIIVRGSTNDVADPNDPAFWRVRNSVRGLDGDDIITLVDGRVSGNVHGDAGNNTITMSGSSDVASVFGGNIDIIQIYSGNVRGRVFSSSDVDKITIGDPENPGVASPTIAFNVDAGDGDDQILFVNGRINGDFQNSTLSLDGGTGRDEIWLYGGTIARNVSGGDGDDTIVLGGVADSVLIPNTLSYFGSLTAGSIVSGAIRGGAGVDTINIVTGQAGAVEGGDGVDTITQTGGSVLSIDGGNDGDTITLTSGTIRTAGDAVTGGAGNDTITLNGMMMTGSILGGADTDTFKIESGSTAAVDGGTARDIFFLSGGTVIGSIIGGDGGDEINLGSTAAGGLTNGTTIGGDVLGGAGDDIINWRSGGFANTINGGTGSDTVGVASASGYDGSQILDGGDDALPGDTFIDKLTISGKTVSVSSANLTNWEQFHLDNTSLTLTNATITVGGTGSEPTMGVFLQNGASLRTQTALDLSGNLNIGAGSRLEQLFGNAHAISGRLTNTGTVDLQDGAASDVLAVGGSYAGGGQLLVDIDGDTADRMTVAGDVLGAPTRIVTKLIGENTTGIPIEVVHVEGATKAGDFTAADFNLGAYSYALQLDGGTWQFAPTEMLGEGTLYPTIGRLVGQFGKQTIATHFERTGSWARARATGEDVASTDGVMTLAGGDRNSNGNVWMRAIGQWAEGEGALKGGAASIGTQKLSYDADTGGVQGGVDAVVADTPSYLVTAGLFGQTGRLSGSVKNETTRTSSGSSEADAWGIGGSIGLDTENFYVEAVGAWNSYDISMESRVGSADTDANGYFVSLEAGREFAVSTSIKLVPQAQFAWVNTNIDDFTDAAGTSVTFEDHTTPIGRLGLAVDAAAGTYNGMPLRLTGILNYWQEFGDAAQTSVGGAPLEIDQTDGSIEAGAGFHWGNEQTPLHLHGELTYSDAVGGDGEQSWNGTMGMRIAF